MSLDMSPTTGTVPNDGNMAPGAVAYCTPSMVSLVVRCRYASVGAKATSSASGTRTYFAPPGVVLAVVQATCTVAPDSDATARASETAFSPQTPETM